MPETMNTGTVLIEEGALLRDSFQLESEPWTSFFTAAAIIRELRKAPAKQSNYESEDNMAHSDKVIDHSNHPRNAGSLPKDDPNVGTGLVDTPEGRDLMELQMKINSETQVMEFTTFGGGSAIASPSLATKWVKGKTSRKRWPSRTRISAASSAFPRARLFDVTRHPRIGGRLHLVGSPIF